MRIGVPSVPYRLPGESYTQWISIYNRLYRERIIFVGEPIDDGIANNVVAVMLYLNSTDPGKDILMYINSPGGSVSAGLAIYDTMQHISSDVVTICLGQAVGVAALLLSSGTTGKRASLPHANLALSHPYSGTQGQASDIDINAKQVISKRRSVIDILAENTGQTHEKLTADMGRTFYMTPQEAKDYGLIDRVLESPKEAIASPLKAST